MLGEGFLFHTLTVTLTKTDITDMSEFVKKSNKEPQSMVFICKLGCGD